VFARTRYHTCWPITTQKPTSCTEKLSGSSGSHSLPLDEIEIEQLGGKVNAHPVPAPWPRSELSHASAVIRLACIPDWAEAHGANCWGNRGS
jgi:hypothetical protein